jgi:glycerol-3-phosphate acyltransferase PlsX
MKYKIGVDISGGDRAPGEILKGALLAHDQLKEEVVLIGRKQEIEEQLALSKRSPDEFTIFDAPEKIEMAEKPVAAIRRKKKSSIVVGVDLLRDRKIDAFVSCGNTGAVVGASTLRLRLIEGVERPGIALLVPTKTGVSLIVDVGANIDCKPSHLFQYGIMASVYYHLVFNKAKPTVGLLNIGEEASKGLGILKDLHKLLSNSPLNFIGNVEAKDLFSGKCDCIVCDGFIGNIALKVAEGSMEAVARFLVDSAKEGILGKIGLFFLLPNLKKFKRKMDYAEYGGAPLLGVNGIVIIGHGRSNSLAVKNAVKVASQELSRNLTAEIKARINEIYQDSGVRQILTP